MLSDGCERSLPTFNVALPWAVDCFSPWLMFFKLDTVAATFLGSRGGGGGGGGGE